MGKRTKSGSVDWTALRACEKVAAVARFEEKISQAQKNSPPTRDWVRKAI